MQHTMYPLNDPRTQALTGPALTRDALHRALHRLGSLHGLIAADGAAPADTFTLDTAADCAQLVRAINELAP